MFRLFLYENVAVFPAILITLSSVRHKEEFEIFLLPLVVNKNFQVHLIDTHNAILQHEFQQLSSSVHLNLVSTVLLSFGAIV